MAIANGTTPLSALRKLIDLGGTCHSQIDRTWSAEEFTGTREALLESGVATEDMLPSGSKRKTYFGLDAQRRVLSWAEHCARPYDSEVRKYSRRGRCEKGRRGILALTLHCSDSQVAEIEPIRLRYKSHNDFKERVAWNLAVHLSMMRGGIRGHAEYNMDSYRFAKENEILALIELIEDKLRASEVLVPPAKAGPLLMLPQKRPALRLIETPRLSLEEMNHG